MVYALRLLLRIIGIAIQFVMCLPLMLSCALFGYSVLYPVFAFGQWWKFNVVNFGLLEFTHILHYYRHTNPSVFLCKHEALGTCVFYEYTNGNFVGIPLTETELKELNAGIVCLRSLFDKPNKTFYVGRFDDKSFFGSPYRNVNAESRDNCNRPADAMLPKMHDFYIE